MVEITKNHPDCLEEIRLIQAGLITIGQLINSSPCNNGNGTMWREITTRAETERAVLCKHLEGKALYSALLRLYATTHKELRDSLQPEREEPFEEFREQRRRKRNPSEEQPTTPKKAAGTTGSVGDPSVRPQVDLPTRNFYAPLRTEMELEDNSKQQEPTNQAGRPPPIILTSAVNLLQLQKQLRSIVQGSFEFWTTKTGTRVVTKEMVDFSAIKTFFTYQKLSFFSFFPKSQKPVKAVIRHIPSVIPAEEICEALMELGFDVISVKQMNSTHQISSDDPEKSRLPLFLVTLPRTEKSQDIFTLASLCHISIKVEMYGNRNGLTQCYNCQKFGHVWANCHQPPRCMWCGGAHLHTNLGRTYQRTTPSAPLKCRDNQNAV
jgi:hypothetical protein